MRACRSLDGVGQAPLQRPGKGEDYHHLQVSPMHPWQCDRQGASDLWRECPSRSTTSRAVPELMGLTGRATALLLEKCREENPLVQCITNFVSMDLMANTLLAAGASPAMVRRGRLGGHCRPSLEIPYPPGLVETNISSPQAHSISEVESFVELASALLVNVGTLSEDWAGGMKLAAMTAGRLRKPWVLDPVACGATPARTSVGWHNCDKWWFVRIPPLPT